MATSLSTTCCSAFTRRRAVCRSSHASIPPNSSSSICSWTGRDGFWRSSLSASGDGGSKPLRLTSSSGSRVFGSPPPPPTSPPHRHGEDQAPANCRLRGRRLPLRGERAGGGLTPPGALRRQRSFAPRGLHLRVFGSGATEASDPAPPSREAARIHGTCPRRSQPMEHEAVDGVGTPRAAAGGGSPLRSLHGWTISAWHALPP